MRWLLLLIPHFAPIVARYPMAIVAVLFFSTPDKRSLTRMKWLLTIDNDLSGDSGFKNEHLIGTDPLSTLNRIRWLWRNGGNAINYGPLGVCESTSEESIKLLQEPGPFLEREDGAWLYRRFLPFVFGRQLELFFGWALLGPQHGRCKYVCSIRFPKVT